LSTLSSHTALCAGFVALNVGQLVSDVTLDTVVHMHSLCPEGVCPCEEEAQRGSEVCVPVRKRLRGVCPCEEEAQ
ncbi:hypothetical protein JOQ06_007929, partial [Pogonophryne albipinna]